MITHMLDRLLVAGVATVFLAQSVLAADSITLEVSAGECERANVPVLFELPEAWRAHQHFDLVKIGPNTQRPVSAQREDTNPPRLIWLIKDKLRAGAARRYRLTAADRPSTGQDAVRCVDDEKTLQLTVGKRHVLTYNQQLLKAADRKESYYDRSGFIHPVSSPSGKVLTDNLAPDHKHQHGIMYPWRDCSFEGHTVDFWHEKLQLGKVRHAKLESAGNGPVFAHFVVRLDHVDLTTGGKKVLDETWRVRVYNLADPFLFDVESVQTCATKSPLTVKKFNYGGMAIRGSRQWSDPKTFDFLTSQAKGRNQGNHTRPKWCAIYGPVDGEPAGLTTLCHPDNFRFPQPVRLHPTMPYYCWSPMVLDDFQIEPGKEFVTKYRFVAHDGKPDPASAERLWQDYAHPVKVRIVEKP